MPLTCRFVTSGHDKGKKSEGAEMLVFGRTLGGADELLVKCLNETPRAAQLSLEDSGSNTK
jgi:hypothetical protein